MEISSRLITSSPVSEIQCGFGAGICPELALALGSDAMFLRILLPLSFFLGAAQGILALGDAEESLCLLHLRTQQSVQGKLPRGFSAYRDISKASQIQSSLIRVAVFDGHPSERADLVPDTLTLPLHVYKIVGLQKGSLWETLSFQEGDELLLERG